MLFVNGLVGLDVVSITHFRTVGIATVVRPSSTTVLNVSIIVSSGHAKHACIQAFLQDLFVALLNHN